MTFIIPMAGKGTRFVQEGYAVPKYMIKVKGKTLFEYALESLPLEVADKLIFICLEDHESFHVSDFIQKKTNHNNIKIVKLNQTTRGQAETVYQCKNLIAANDEILIYNIDTSFKSTKLKNLLNDRDLKKDGIIGAFIDESTDTKWSFAICDDKENVIKTTEKDKISNYALTGLYHFSNANDFFRIAQQWIKSNKTIHNEFYIAPMYNDLIMEGKKFALDIADTFIPLGTPQDVKNFESN